MNWFIISHMLPKIVYENAETGQYIGPSKIASHLNEIKLEGFNLIWVVRHSRYVVFTDSKWYFEVSRGERRQIEIQFEFDGSVPIRAHSNTELDLVILELSDGRYIGIRMPDDDAESGEWLKRVVEIPTAGTVLGFSCSYCVSVPDYGAQLTLTPYMDASPAHEISLDYQAIFIDTHIFVVTVNPVGCTSRMIDLETDYLDFSDESMWTTLPICPTGFAVTNTWDIMAISHQAVYVRISHPSGAAEFEYAYDLPAEMVESRDDLVLCANGFIYRLGRNRCSRMNVHPCSLPPSRTIDGRCRKQAL